MLGLVMVAAGAVAAGFYGYRRLQSIEKEIRSDMTAASASRDAEGRGAEESVPPVAAGRREVAAEMKPPSETGSSLDDRLKEAVSKEPGILQTTLYERFPEVKTRVLQQTLLKMDREGRLRRVREGGSYSLYPG
ncbi:hypothetical protein DSOUD_1648 [Desulfuromonas soudanensis]|uniref:Uncharacterized protein n=1 Tax=Desulfuromonas soudanensis TaxID=1603606 RepID=A0A0M4D2B6_9BACT|nr:hypothetical protein [Desulfuromonas soudanensis]ALC16426.1 hypothetical protein DSOUD_1648 [Desulfuromonas soudanensis]